MLKDISAQGSYYPDIYSHDMMAAACFRPLTNLVDRGTSKGWYVQILSYVTHPIDDVIRTFSVLWFGTIAHFYDIYNCLQKGKYIEGFIKIIATPLWFPTKLSLKISVFALFTLVQAPLSLIIPYRTILGCIAHRYILARLSIVGSIQHPILFPLKSSHKDPQGLNSEKGPLPFLIALSLM